MVRKYQLLDSLENVPTMPPGLYQDMVQKIVTYTAPGSVKETSPVLYTATGNVKEISPAWKFWKCA